MVEVDIKELVEEMKKVHYELGYSMAIKDVLMEMKRVNGDRNKMLEFLKNKADSLKESVNE